MPEANTIGLMIRRARQRKLMTQAELAEALGGVAKSTVVHWENGTHFPRRYAGAIEAVLEITLPAEPVAQ